MFAQERFKGLALHFTFGFKRGFCHCLLFATVVGACRNLSCRLQRETWRQYPWEHVGRYVQLCDMGRNGRNRQKLQY